ncbi:MAG TPA: hypothetical protein VMI06_10245 [Terriglobia bacterium]|nr:hypothetical protein [Terriglobia bacterium]
MNLPTKTNSRTLKPVHPFPARMVPSMLWRKIGRASKPLRILDPMLGSGTTAVVSRLRGHHALGFDSDPLALLIAGVWSADIDPERVRRRAKRVLDRATAAYSSLRLFDAYPEEADEETREFIRYWFDSTNRRQLATLARRIRRVKNVTERSFLWCAFSRLIITKTAGASLALDVSHSRPHKAYQSAPVRPFEKYLASVEKVLRGAPFGLNNDMPKASIQGGDARALPLRSSTIDLVITSPPYLNAIDYLRGHKMSLVWMGYSLRELRNLRSDNIGTERANLDLIDQYDYVLKAISRMGPTGQLASRIRGMLARYVFDMDQVMAEIARVLKRTGAAVVVVGDSSIRGIFVRNSRALSYLGRRNGLVLRSMRRRPLEVNRRYLPPPQHQRSGIRLQSRMREEVILTFEKH